MVSVFFFYASVDHRDLHVLTHSFPTRRSSDLRVRIGRVREVRAVAQPAFDADTGAGGNELPAGFRGDGDAPLTGRGLARDSDRHCHAWLRGPVAGHRSESPAGARLQLVAQWRQCPAAPLPPARSVRPPGSPPTTEE